MPVLDLKLYTTISVCVALVAFIYSCNIFTFQKWFSFTHLPTPVDNLPNQATLSSNGFDRIAEKGPGITTSIFQNMLSEKYLAPRKPFGLMGPFLTSLVNFLQKEKFCVMIFINMAYCFVFLLGRLTLKFFFGELRVIESQHMYDRLLNFLLFKVVFVGAILEPKWEELLIWTTWFTILGFLRIFSMLCRDRFEYLTFTPNTPVQAHLRILTLLILILLSDIFWFIMCISVFRSMLLLLTFECFTLFLDTVQTLVKYIIHLRDITRQSVWESRGILLYYTEFVTDTLILVATLAHYLHIMLLHGISFTLIDAVLFLNMRSVFNNLRKKIAAYYSYRQAIFNMQTQYPNATDIELNEYNDDCAICRDSMDSAKKLPCGHMFHLTCLRSWLEHHGSCPTCRRSLLKGDSPIRQRLLEHLHMEVPFL
ncbi:11999_t:CDS:2 [Funneliformis mosseae]|uniref:11999_t:CDS:1 n=1 Tax=Funneliformis mosseae TaxID=27381 RepID=A0A9N9FUW4_FUNMO|nr:11999_t:CDS:2 [Funneliformis mosseae]